MFEIPDYSRLWLESAIGDTSDPFMGSAASLAHGGWETRAGVTASPGFPQLESSGLSQYDGIAAVRPPGNF
jgi:hypothetical protein